MMLCTWSLLPDRQNYHNSLMSIDGDNKQHTTLMKFTPREVFQHNLCAGLNKWGIFEGRVYDNEKLKEIFSRITTIAKETRMNDSNQEVDTEDLQAFEFFDSQYDEGYFDYSCQRYCCQRNICLDTVVVWNKNSIPEPFNWEWVHKTVKLHAAPFCVGTVVQPSDREFLEDIQKDVEGILNDLVHYDCMNKLSENLSDYMHLLQRWVKKYTSCKAIELPRGNSNQSCIPVTENIAENPECLRPWIVTWKRFNCVLPENGAWAVVIAESSDLKNSHEIFLSSLKSHVDFISLDTTIDGEAAWDVIQSNLFAEDVMTDEQIMVEQQRKNRTDLLDGQRMKKRRECLLQYFLNKYRYSRADVEKYLNWAEEMRLGEERFIKLCERS